MPQFFTDDFADFPGGWTERFNAPATGTFNVSSGNLVMPSGKSGDWATRSWNAIDADANRDQIEVLVLLQQSATVGDSYPLQVRASGADEAASQYALQLTSTVGRLRWNKCAGTDAPNTVGAASADKGAITAGEQIWVRVRVTGRTPDAVLLQARWWRTADSEPGSWDVSVSDSTTPIYTAGWVAVGSFGVSAVNAHTILQIGVGTNGDAAPGSTPPPPDTTQPDVTSTGTGATNGPFAANVAESSAAAFITLTASENVTWGALGGADAAFFQKTSETATTVQLRPASGFDFEALPHANPFVVTVTATDGATPGNVRTVTVNATVTNVSEPPLAPTIGTATTGDATVSIAFTPPVNTGRPGITVYTATITGGIVKEGATSPITFTGADGVVNGTAYTGTVTATNADGMGPPSAASNSVTPSSGAIAPSITLQASNQSVTAPTAATFSAAASGTPTPTVQWQRNPGGVGSWANVSGATSTTLTTGATSVTGGFWNNGDQVRPVFTNSEGSATGSAATLTVSAAAVAPTITVQPGNQTVAAGATATFSVTANGSGLTYQWRRNGSNISGATSISYTTPATTVSGGSANNGDVYSVVVTGDTAPAATSSNATLTVNAAPAALTLPAVATDATGSTRRTGQTTRMVVEPFTSIEALGTGVRTIATGTTDATTGEITLTGLSPGTYAVFGFFPSTGATIAGVRFRLVTVS